MKNIAYIMKNGNMDYNNVLKLPYGIFLSLVKQFRMLELESTPEGQKLLEESNRITNTKPDMSRLSQIGIKRKAIEK